MTLGAFIILLGVRRREPVAGGRGGAPLAVLCRFMRHKGCAVTLARWGILFNKTFARGCGGQVMVRQIARDPSSFNVGQSGRKMRCNQSK